MITVDSEDKMNKRFRRLGAFAIAAEVRRSAGFRDAGPGFEFAVASQFRSEFQAPGQPQFLRDGAVGIGHAHAVGNVHSNQHPSRHLLGACPRQRRIGNEREPKQRQEHQSQDEQNPRHGPGNQAHLTAIERGDEPGEGESERRQKTEAQRQRQFGKGQGEPQRRISERKMNHPLGNPECLLRVYRIESPTDLAARRP